jgi:hypothetical protein
MSLGSFNAAFVVYDRGAFSDPIAELKLGVPLSNPLSEGDKVLGYSMGGVNAVNGYAIDNFPKGSTAIEVAYEISPIQANYVGCQVGGNPNPKTEGCKLVALSYFPGSECIAVHCFLIPL